MHDAENYILKICLYFSSSTKILIAVIIVLFSSRCKVKYLPTVYCTIIAKISQPWAYAILDLAYIVSIESLSSMVYYGSDLVEDDSTPPGSNDLRTIPDRFL